ncbi:MAG TPA: YicC/YloC family endoribonuclease [Bacteroidales bacterium]|nr:YicC/YloC family endoribonuclease [Bacteroidales bacterium]
MFKSMTGYGKATCQIQNRRLSVEVRALNSKSLDVALKLPGFLREKEQIVRGHISQKMLRGKIDVVFSTEGLGGGGSFAINGGLIVKYLSDLDQLAKEHNIKIPEDILSVVLRMPDVLTAETLLENPDDWLLIEEALLFALNQVDQFRTSEGEYLANDMLERVGRIEYLSKQIEPLESGREQAIRARISKSLNDLKENVQADPNRFEQELIFYLEKLDITEEMVRLGKHLQYFEETIKNETAQGRKLGFIAQEIGREINTIGSKANESGIQKLVVQMKDELEKIKEQLLNIL